MKQHTKKPPKKEERPKTAKKAIEKDIVVNNDNENDYEQFVNGNPKFISINFVHKLEIILSSDLVNLRSFHVFKILRLSSILLQN